MFFMHVVWLIIQDLYRLSITAITHILFHAHEKKIIENYTSQNKIDTDVSRIPDRVIVEFMQI